MFDSCEQRAESCGDRSKPKCTEFIVWQPGVAKRGARVVDCALATLGDIEQKTP